jgi:peptide/nickel transport system ATP-binding protein
MAVADRTALLHAREVTKHFPAGRGRGMVHAVDGVSLALPRGSITAVVGESGSGKSTLARLFARLLKPTSGRLLLDGQPVPSGRGGRRRYAQQVQMVLQDPFASLNPVHDVRYHLTRPLKVHGLGPSRSLEESLHALLERVALTPPGPVPRQVPARAVRRAAAASGDRPGACRAAAGAARR